MHVQHCLKLVVPTGEYAGPDPIRLAKSCTMTISNTLVTETSMVDDWMDSSTASRSLRGPWAGTTTLDAIDTSDVLSMNAELKCSYYGVVVACVCVCVCGGGGGGEGWCVCGCGGGGGVPGGGPRH